MAERRSPTPEVLTQFQPPVLSPVRLVVKHPSDKRKIVGANPSRGIMNEQEALEIFLKYAFIGFVYFLFAFKNTRYNTKVILSTGVRGTVLLIAMLILTCMVWPVYIIFDMARMVRRAFGP